MRQQYIKAWEDLHAACHALWVTIVKELRLQQIVDWIAKALS